MSKRIGIYKITSPIGRIYIGQSSDINSRFSAYRRFDCKYQIRLLNSLKKHGVEDHVFEILEECDRSVLDSREIHWIEFYNSFNNTNGLNMRSGGANGLMSDETKAKISKNNSRNNKGKKASDETREKIRQARLRQPDPNLGKKRSEEIKQKFSEMRKGIKPTVEAIEKRRQSLLKSEKFQTMMRSDERKEAVRRAHIGSKRSEETKIKLKNAWDYDKHFTPETKAKISAGNVRRWEREKNEKKSN